VKFLVDHQLPPALATFLQSHGHIAQHVREVGLKSDDDLTIWEHVVANELILISKDEDFFHLANRTDEKGKLIWIRLGNCRNQSLFAAFESALPQISDSIGEGCRLIELR
jgi:predicted nuclease of predicted toxin-antitoxin system